MGTELILLSLGIGVVVALSFYGLLYLLKQAFTNGEDTVERAKEAVTNAADDDIVAEFKTFEEWEQSQILYIAESVEEFENIVEMWRPQD